MTLMSRAKLGARIADLFRSGAWTEARKILETDRERDPKNHWVLTQLGVTFYEQRRYEEALPLFLASREIVPDCPLTLWNLAGTLDALGKYPDAIRIYTWLLQSKKSADDDPCWESREWTAALKTDCVFRLGECFRKQGKKDRAERCYRQYIDLLLAGIDGSYSIEDTMRKIRDLHGVSKNNGAASELRKAALSMQHQTSIEPARGRRNAPPELNIGNLLGGRRMAAKK